MHSFCPTSYDRRCHIWLLDRGGRELCVTTGEGWLLRVLIERREAAVDVLHFVREDVRSAAEGGQDALIQRLRLQRPSTLREHGREANRDARHRRMIGAQ